MSKITEKKDFKILIFLFSIEIILLTIMMIVAHLSLNDNVKQTKSHSEFSDSLYAVSNNILKNSFNGEGISALNKLDKNDSSEDTNTICKFYTFNLSDNGITSNLLRTVKNTQMNGIAANTATSTVIQPAVSDFGLGAFKIHNNYVNQRLDLEEILSKPLVIEPMDKNSILIYHVHASEGYCHTEADKYKLNSHTIEGEEDNVVAAGNVLQNTIMSKSGIKVIHDKTLFEEGLESSVSYNNAAKKLDEIYASNSNIKLQIDLHRNAAVSNNKKYGPTVEANGIKYAQISFVIGLDWSPVTGDRSDSTNPYWEDNFKLCMLITEKLEEKVPGICRRLELRRNPYNQNYAENSLLTEIGFAGNLYSEAENTAKLLGEIINDIYG